MNQTRWPETLDKMTDKATKLLKLEASKNSMDHFKNITLGESVPQDKQRHIILAADFRTGSSFLGKN